MQQSPDVLVVEPYGELDKGALRNLLDFCDKYELDCMVFPTSASPTQTMHVRIWPKDLPRPDY